MLPRLCAALVVCSGCGRIGYDPHGGDGGAIDAATDAATDAPTDGPLEQLLAGCVLFARMDEPVWTGGAGEVGDACGGDDRGTAVNGAVTTADGLRGSRAGLFPGGGGCVVIPDRPGLHPTSKLTVSAWIYPLALDGVTEHGLISKRRDYLADAAYSVFAWTGDHVYVDVATEDQRFNGSAVLTNNAWHQVTVVFDGDLPANDRSRLYVDAVLDVVVPDTATVIPPFTSDLHVGCLPLGAPAQGFIGRMDDVAVWHRALSPVEVQAWYDATRP